MEEENGESQGGNNNGETNKNGVLIRAPIPPKNPNITPACIDVLNLSGYFLQVSSQPHFYHYFLTKKKKNRQMAPSKALKTVGSSSTFPLYTKSTN